MNILRTLILVLWSSMLFADSWINPEIRYYSSENKKYCVKTVPRYIPDKYYKWRSAKPSKKSKFTAADTTFIPAHALMYEINGADSIVLWEKQLINGVAPVSGLVTDDGKYFITFNNWYTMGYGIDVMVVYNDKGEMIKRYNLEEISPYPINDYELSISSIWWLCGHKVLDNTRVEICYKTKTKDIKKRVYLLNKLSFEN